MTEKINNTKRDFKGIWIPAKIWLNKDMSLLEKCLLMEINSLDNNDGCYASNEYLAEFLNTSVATITRAISRLKVIGYINQASFDGRNRVLHTDNNKIEPNQNDEADNAICGGGVLKLSKSSMYRNKDNIHAAKPPEASLSLIQDKDSFNKQANAEGLESPPVNTAPPPFQDNLNNIKFITVWQEWIAHRKEKKQKLTPSTMKKQLEFLSKNSDDAIEIINRSIMYGWQGLFPLNKQNVDKKQPQKIQPDHSFDHHREFVAKCVANSAAKEAAK